MSLFQTVNKNHQQNQISQKKQVRFNKEVLFNVKALRNLGKISGILRSNKTNKINEQKQEFLEFNTKKIKKIDLNNNPTNHQNNKQIKQTKQQSPIQKIEEQEITLVKGYSGSITQGRYFLEYKMGYIITYDFKEFTKKAIEVYSEPCLNQTTDQGQLYLQNNRLLLSGGISLQGTLSSLLIIFSLSPSPPSTTSTPSTPSPPYTLSTTQMIKPRYNHTQVLLDTSIYIIAGEDQKGNKMRHCETFDVQGHTINDPTTTCKEIKRMNLKRSCCLLQANQQSRQLYVLGGSESDIIPHSQIVSFEIYSADKDIWVLSYLKYPWKILPLDYHFSSLLVHLLSSLTLLIFINGHTIYLDLTTQNITTTTTTWKGGQRTWIYNNTVYIPSKNISYQPATNSFKEQTFK